MLSSWSLAIASLLTSRIATAHSLRIRDAVLTGEAVPVEKAIDAVPEDAPLGDRRSMAFSGAVVAAGSRRGVAVATGSATEIVRTSCVLDTAETSTTPLLKQMEGALVTFGWKAGEAPDALRKTNPKTDAIPFDAHHRFMATLHHDHEGFRRSM